MEAYETRDAEREPASLFYQRVSREAGLDLDLEAVIRETRRPHSGIDM